jgi:dTDP-4-dehydrorhamnose 3,5-epimerase
VVRGTVFDVAVDIRPSSATFGQWAGVTLSDENHRQFWVPPGYAHGFVVLSDVADFVYRCTDYYHPQDEIGLLWNDPEVDIAWPVEAPRLSDKDLRLPRLAALRQVLA